MAMLLPLAGAAVGGLIAPGAIGFLGLTGASAGWLAGSFISSMLAPTQKVQGPRLSDLQVISSQYGSPIPYVFGHPRISGQVVWGSVKREIATTTRAGGKGGPKVEATNFTYEVDLLIMFSANVLAGVRRIWSNGKLVWTASANSDFQSIAASSDFATAVRFHSGADDQLPDPTYEAAVGVGNAPAYRGRSTLMLQGLQLGQSGQIPNLTIEVMEAASRTTNSQEVGATPTPAANYFSGTSYMTPESSIVIQTLWDNNYFSTAAKVWEISAGGTVTFLRQITSRVSSAPISGATDEAVLMLGTGDATWANGDRTRFYNAGTTWRFAKRGDTAVFVHNWSGTGNPVQLSRHWQFGRDAISVDSYPANTVSVPEAIQSLWIQDDKVYALATGNANGVRTIYVYDVEDLTLLYTLSSPYLSAGINQTITFDEAGYLHIVDITLLYRYVNGVWVTRAIPNGYGAGGNPTNGEAGNACALFNDVLYSQPHMNGPLWTVKVRASWVVTEPIDKPLPDAIVEIAELAGLSAAQVNTSALAGQVIRSAVITPTTARQLLDMLANAYMFEFVGSSVLKAVPRGGAPVATIPWGSLGTVRDGDTPSEPLPLKVRNDIEVPAFVHLKYSNVLSDYADGLESSDRLATESNAVQLIEVPLGFTPTEAKRLADKLANDLQASLITVGPIDLDRTWEHLESTDVLTVLDEDGSAFRVRAQKRTKSGGLISIEAVLDDATVVNSSAVTAGDYTSTSTIVLPPQSRALLLDVPMLRDADNSAAAYVAVDALSLPFPGANLYMGADAYTLVSRGQVTEEAPIGYIENAPGDWQFNTLDTINTFVVNVGDSPLYSVTRDAMYDDGANAWAIGAPGRWEIGQSMTFTPLGGGRYRVSGHLRGRRGTEHNVNMHQPLDYFVLLNPNGLLRPSFDLSELNQPRVLRSVTAGRSIASASTSEGSNSGVALKPFSVVNVRKVTATNNDQSFSWNWRTRLSGEFPNGAEIPFSEATHTYEIEIFTSNSFTSVAGTRTVTTEVLSLTSAEQTAMGITPGGTRYMDIYPISALVGRGQRRRVTL